ncbi:MAG TPA: hypothetical protein VHX60_09520 [Acidobacteriaceae bacterium]|nr:hypothetical protein [Acidobacteriaceae bacterium]
MRAPFLSRCLPALATAAIASTCVAQVMQAPGTLPNGRRMNMPPAWQSTPQNPAQNQRPAAAALNSAAPAPATPAVPPTAAPEPSVPLTAPSLLDKPAQPAQVTLAAGMLSVAAENSSLNEILHQLGKSTGMSIDGLEKDTRIFGTYGPGTPRDILSSLLEDAGYNVLMVGSTDDGAPRQLILSSRSNTPVSARQPVNVAQQDEDQEDNQPVNVNQPMEEAPMPPPRQPAMPMNQQNPNGSPRTPQQMLQELQQMRMQQQQQQQQPPQ